jgi:predicted small integral membrane protein
MEFVKHVFAMDTTFNDPDVTWRAITSSAIQNIAYVLIIAWEVLTALVLIWAFVAWVGALRRGGGYDRPRRLSTLGWTMVLLLFAGGFIVIGGEWFVMWQSSDWNGLDPALQNVIIAGLALILAHLPSREWSWPAPGVIGSRLGALRRAPGMTSAGRGLPRLLAACSLLPGGDSAAPSGLRAEDLVTNEFIDPRIGL